MEYDIRTPSIVGARDSEAVPSSERLLHDTKAHAADEIAYVKWGIAWGVPAMMLGFTLAGVAIAVGHHGYYMSLHGTTVGSSARQNWALRFGTAFSFLSVALLRTACNVAYKQYIWTLFKRRAYSITDIDRLFQLTNDLTSMRSWKLMRRADLAFTIAFVCWCLPFTGVTPPATLSVGHGFENTTKWISLPTIDWKSPHIADILAYTSFPSSYSLQLASRAALDMAVLRISPPAPTNVSFHQQFHGPTVRCALANESQQPAFDAYTDFLWDDSYIAGSRAAFESGKLKWGNATDPETKQNYTEIPSLGAPEMNIFSAFTLTAGGLGWHSGADESNVTSPDMYNNWWPSIPEDTMDIPYWSNHNYHVWANDTYAYDNVPYSLQQIYVQTADQSIVCTLGNASFDVDFTFIDGVQVQSDYNITGYEPFWAPELGVYTSVMMDTNDTEVYKPEYFAEMNSYIASFVAFSSLLNGNVTTTLTNLAHVNMKSYVSRYDGNAIITPPTSETLKTGLSACPEYAHGSWDDLGAIGIGPTGPATWDKSFNQTVNGTGPYQTLPNEYFTGIDNHLFNKPSWMCRKGSLMAAIEDLANNVTISMLSESAFLKENGTEVPVHYFLSQNVYTYNSKNLIISYSVAIGVTVLAVIVGLYSLHFNGVAHSSNFSAILGTTRNPELDKYVRGHSLGVFGGSRGQGIGKGDNIYQMELERGARLRFGELVGGKGDKHVSKNGSIISVEAGRDDEAARHIGFGSVENVAMIKKGGKYV